MTIFSRFMKDESGATAIEYGMIAALLALGIAAALGTLRQDIESAFDKIGDKLEASIPK